MTSVKLADNGDGSLMTSGGEMDPEEWEAFLPRDTVWGIHVIGHREGLMGAYSTRQPPSWRYRIIQDCPCLLVIIPAAVLILIVAGLIIL